MEKILVFFDILLIGFVTIGVAVLTAFALLGKIIVAMVTAAHDLFVELLRRAFRFDSTDTADSH